ncbi:serine protein kinase [Candidatus Falkowbacteria bacterium RIFOXYB2_FULL_34_18]|uniref:Serine protein kinase n=1 Tax=Candidatus Falkowbacteria bacterium RIFOXYD2_FULL_34_120 TaxID=1798007 RepID=A0A1F5TMC6_9BACT|nr:MAG: serine protein kinase [Candidatus Falkowbacteria bacterium RIFOXYB2_FULL_34_18]OGF30280.1 MAG: serine protein kinase [Candidatus Falkowbacteria bacterium RIFOXYC12_FULL_34_55]OGF37831.1 MAG: serine protein kinase [Candidatus Falkowbacteria bacterium RIFOXYC2_FULL_34_220]OGF39592.1 MAG: serine protein kinase [Candidatus Falkowbacteria bacterium RIFOXYD12_FULL_34_57]OGF40016.1 MAG: serine protein kinase [Candidatus Falkowbacteria bacterium RIFOXYD2_FULL_34_120]
MSKLVTLEQHVKDVKSGKKVFENAFQGVSRMILSDGVETITWAGKKINNFKFFRAPGKHLVGLYEEINSFVSFVKDASEGGSSKEMAFILVGEPGNGKTFFVEYLCNRYREFLSLPENKKYTFQFKDLEKLGGFGKIKKIESQTYEDPMILAMNLMESKGASQEALQNWMKFKDEDIRKLYKNYRPLGACSGYIWDQIREYTEGDLAKMLEFIKIVPVPLTESLGTVTGKYPAKDKITSSSIDLLGEESIPRLLHISDTDNPYRFDLRRGALARVAGGGIHFSDETFKNKKDLVQVYLGVIQNRTIEIDGFKWPLDVLIIGTSNNDEFSNFVAERSEAPIIDRCRICYVSHNTDYKLQEKLTSYALGTEKKTTVNGDALHEDPNMNYAASVGVILTRLPHNNKLTPIETMKLAAGDIAGEKSSKTLIEVIDELAQNPDITKHFGQRGLGQRNLGRAIQLLLERNETCEGKCMFALDIFNTLQKVVLTYVHESGLREKYKKDIDDAKKLYRDKIMETMFNAYMDDPEAIKKDVFRYVNMIIGIDAENLGPDKMWKYKDPQTGDLKPLKIDEKFIQSVEARLGLKTREQSDTFRNSVRKIYGQKLSTDRNYDFMDNLELIKAVTDVRLKSDIAGAGSLIGALANRTNEENEKLYTKIMKSMIDKLGYCPTCAVKTIEFFCTYEE